jgi:hypothetical protein
MGANLTVLADIKDLAWKTETLEGEKKNKPNGPNLQISSVDEETKQLTLPITKQLTLSIRATDIMSTVEISEADHQNSE